MKTSLKPLIAALVAMRVAAVCLYADGPETTPKPPAEAKKSSTEKTDKGARVDLSQAQFLDGVLAIVNDKLVTVQDVYAESRFLEEQSKLGYSPSEWEHQEIRAELMKQAHAIRVSIANRLVTELLISAEFTRRGYQLPESIVDQRLHKAAGNATKGDLEALREQLQATGLTMKGFRDRIRRRLHSDILLNQEVFETIKVSPRDVEEYRKRNPDAFKPKRSYKLKVVFFVSKNAKAVEIVAKALPPLLTAGKSLDEINAALAADKTLQAMQKGAKVSAQAEHWTKLDEIDPRFRPHVEKLKKGERSGIIKLNGMVVHFTAVDIREDAVVASDSVDESIRRKLMYLKRKRAEQAFVQRLYNRSYVRKYYQD